MKTELSSILAAEPAYRVKQIQHAWFDPSVTSYEQITTLPASLREKLADFPYLTLKKVGEANSQIDNTRKFLFELPDGALIETVLMGRQNLKENAEEDATDRFTVCISSQAGCPMGCTFCATGQKGFKRNLTTEEIIDQVRFCIYELVKEKARLANIVVMGQGEPLLNYDNLKDALNIILKNTDIGPTKITVSTCGITKMMEKILTDDTFPQIRWAVSLHSAITETRRRIMPSHQDDFFDFLVKWANDYHKIIPSRTHFIGLEYIMIAGVNDDEKHLQALIKLAKRMPRVRINLIPFNSGTSENYQQSESNNIKKWHDALMKEDFVSTIRHSQGQDIAAACGQLANQFYGKSTQ